MLRDFIKNSRGNVVIIFALAALPLFVAVGIGIDYGRGVMSRNALQSAADAAALAAASALTDDNDERIAAASSVFSLNNKQRGATLTVVVADDRVTASAKLNQSNAFGKLIGLNETKIGVKSVALRPKPGKGEIALVLDYSGSMKSSGKYEAMSSAAVDFVEAVLDENDEIKIGLIPFSEYVYSDISTTFIRGVHRDKHDNTVSACLNSRRSPYATQSSTPEEDVEDSKWSAPGMPIEWTLPGTLSGGEQVNGEVVDCDDLSKIENDKCKSAESETKDQCKATEKTTKEQCEFVVSSTHPDYKDLVKDCEKAAKDTKETCEDNARSAKSVCEQRAKDLKDLDQCIKTSKGASGSVSSEITASDFAASYPQCSDYLTRGVKVLPLTSDRAALTDQLESMTPLKLTNIALAMEFGFHMLAPSEPYSDAENYNVADNIKTVVLLTDGAQTVGGYGLGNSFNIAQADKNTAQICANMKAEGIKVFTVAFDLSGKTSVKKLLKDCASGADYFMTADEDDQLAEAFKAIVGKLGQQVHLAE